VQTITTDSVSTLTRVCRLAEGGMARVDLAIRRVGAFRRMYAVKRLHPHLASDPDFRSMFLDEARIAGLLRHPNIVGVLDVGEDDQGPFLVMDYVDGLPLSNLLTLVRKGGELMPVQIAVRIALDVARGLHAAHELVADGRPLGLVHRDLSPQNVMIGFDGQARITDFGIARALGRATRTATGVVKGKMAYMSPEQLRLEEPDRRSDLFSFGVVIYEMLSNTRLYGKSAEPRISFGAPPDIGEVRSDVPDELVRLLFELLAAEREARPPDARDVAMRLEAILAVAIAEEEPADVAEYLDVVAGEVKREQSRVLEAAMAEAESAPPIQVVPPKKRRWPLVAVGLGAVAFAVPVVFVLATGSDPVSATPEAAEPGASVASVSAPPPETPAPAAGDPAEAGDPDAGPEVRAVKRVRVRAGRGMTMEMDMEPLPEWVGFER
jgi:serine/threonine-protein kinase